MGISSVSQASYRANTTLAFKKPREEAKQNHDAEAERRLAFLGRISPLVVVEEDKDPKTDQL